MQSVCHIVMKCFLKINTKTDILNSTLTIEDPNLLAKDLIAKNAFEEMDSNHDGVVTMEEFVEACLGESELAQLLALKAVEIFVDN